MEIRTKRRIIKLVKLFGGIKVHRSQENNEVLDVDNDMFDYNEAYDEKPVVVKIQQRKIKLDDDRNTKPRRNFKQKKIKKY